MRRSDRWAAWASDRYTKLISMSRSSPTPGPLESECPSRGDKEGRVCYASPLALIYPSAWKRPSWNFAPRWSPEVRRRATAHNSSWLASRDSVPSGPYRGAIRRWGGLRESANRPPQRAGRLFGWRPGRQRRRRRYRPRGAARARPGPTSLGGSRQAGNGDRTFLSFPPVAFGLFPHSRA
jgi:hypothetical protein